MAKPTYQDAALMFQFGQWANSTVQRKAGRFLSGDKFIADYDAFMEKYPRGSRQYAYVGQILYIFETLGTLYKLGLFNEELLFEWQAVYPIWDRLESHVLGRREAADDPRFYENFELLAKEAKARKP